MKGLVGLLTVEEASEQTDLAIGTFRNYVASGVAPPPVKYISDVPLWSPKDIRFFKQSYKGKPWLRGKRKRG
jgi:hypothetical protein